MEAHSAAKTAANKAWRHWQDLATTEFAALDPAHTVAVLPVAAIEQHGPHLPVSVDAEINRGVLARALTHLAPDVPALILPMTSTGKSNEHIAFPGTLTLSAETLIRLWTELGESVARAGLRKLVLFNSHGGQPQIMDIVARDLRVRLQMMVVSTSWYALGMPPDLYDEDENRFGIHAGGIETSMMLHLRPDLVDMTKARNFRSAHADIAAEFEHLSYTGGTAIAWQTQDLNASGACGDATNADAARGEQLVDFAARRFAELLAEVSRFPLERLRQR